VTGTTKTNLYAIKNLTATVDMLSQLATNRILNGRILNSLQYCMADNIELTRLRLNQTNTLIPATKGSQGKPGTPASSVRSVGLLIDAQHVGRRADSHIDDFRKKLRSDPFLARYLTNDNMIKLPTQSPEQPDPLDTNRIIVLFSLECRFPDLAH
jgi:hypothetical protein